jgi:hypothetical protein
MSNYTHFTIDHILGNMIFYLLFIFIIFNLEKHKNNFYISSIFGFIFLPFIVYYLQKVTFPYFNISLEHSIGFSAITSFFAGYVIFATYSYIKNYLPEINYKFINFILFLNIAFWALIGNYIKIMLLAFSLVVLSVLFDKTHFKKILIHIKEEIIFSNIGNNKKRICQILFFSLLIGVLLIMPSLIPNNIKIGNNTINIVAHFLGYIFGIYAPLIIFYFIKK